MAKRGPQAGPLFRVRNRPVPARLRSCVPEVDLSDNHRPTHGRAIALALLVTLLWSSSWVLIRWGLDDEALEPLTFAAIRYGLAAILLAGWAAARKPVRAGFRTLGSRDLAGIVLLGLFFYAVTQGSQFVAIANQPAATSSLVLALTPLLVAVLAGRYIAEPPTTRQVAGAILVALGAWAYFVGDLGATAVGMAAATVSLLANAASALLGRRVNRTAAVDPVIVTVISMTVGAVVLVGVGLAIEGVPSVSLRGWLIIGWLALVNTALAFSLWNASLRRLSALESAGINNTMLIQIGVLAWAFLGEGLGWAEVVGIVLVSAGVFLTQAAQRRAAP